MGVLVSLWWKESKRKVKGNENEREIKGKLKWKRNEREMKGNGNEKGN